MDAPGTAKRDDSTPARDSSAPVQRGAAARGGGAAARDSSTAAQRDAAARDDSATAQRGAAARDDSAVAQGISAAVQRGAAARNISTAAQRGAAVRDDGAAAQGSGAALRDDHTTAHAGAAAENAGAAESADVADEFDVIVIGAGPVGENAAAYAIAGSERTAVLVERELVGGECSYWACMPSKALLRPGDVLAAAQAMEGVTATGLDVAAVLQRRDDFVHNHDDSSQVDWATDNRIEVLRGAGRLAGTRLVEVSGRLLRARHAVVLATGSVAAIPKVPGLAEALPWTSRDATNLHEIPRRVVILGGGVVACEAATWLAALGAEEITLVVRGQALLGSVEPFAGERVAKALTEAGVQIKFGSTLTAVARPMVEDTGEGRIHGGPVTMALHDEQGTFELAADEIIVAAGRRPTTAGLGLDSVGLPDATVEVDDHLTARGVDGNWLYAVGDVNGRAPLTHMGKYQARVCGDVIAARADGKPLTATHLRATADRDQVTQVVFTAPEVAAVGLTEAAAADAGFTVETVELDIAVAGSSLTRKDFEGRAKLVIDTATDTLLGATFVGPDIGEQLHAATIAVVGRVPLSTLWHAIPAYPTLSEFWLRLLEERRTA